jgi:hypothetical protein
MKLTLGVVVVAALSLACSRQPSPVDTPPFHVPDGAFDREGQTDTRYLHVVALTDGTWQHVTYVVLPRETLVDTYQMPDLGGRQWRLVLTNRPDWPESTP